MFRFIKEANEIVKFLVLKTVISFMCYTVSAGLLLTDVSLNEFF